LAQDGPNPGPPRPTELVYDVALTPTTPDVELVVSKPAAAATSGVWPQVRARLPSGVYEYGIQLELLRGGSTVARSKMRFGGFPDYKPDSSTAVGLLRFTAPYSLPLYCELHSLPLEFDVGKLEFVSPPALAVTIVDARGFSRVAEASCAVHWIGGGSSDAVVYGSGSEFNAFADRREARWVLTVEAPGYRRHRAAGDAYTSWGARLPSAAKAAVELQRW
jgi:hypothetical protein